jgi:murein DD-endopeptidase MepM/ murein hydrolase activator NlpD
MRTSQVRAAFARATARLPCAARALRRMPRRVAALYALSVSVAVLVGFPLGGRLAGAALSHIDRVVQAERLAGEVGVLEARAEELERDLMRLAEEANALRRLAGLEPISLTRRPVRQEAAQTPEQAAGRYPRLRQAGGWPAAAAAEPAPARRSWWHGARLRRTSLDGAGGPDGERPLRHLFYVHHDYDLIALRQTEIGRALREASAPFLADPARLLTMPTILPVDGRLTGGFSQSRRHPVTGRRRPHEGLDVAARSGTPIVATAAGRVSVAGRRGAYGLLVELDHGRGLRTRYAHASRIHVRPGQRVERGDTIARVGSTGLSTGPHVHYEVLKDGRPVNPADFLLPR